MKKTIEEKVKDFNYLVKEYGVYDGYDKNSETESVIGSGWWLVENDDPGTTGIELFTDMPQVIDPETGDEVDAYSSQEEYWDHLTKLHVSEADGEFREDKNGGLWYLHGEDEGWRSVAGDGELGPETDYDDIEWTEEL